MPTFNMLNKNQYYSHCPLKKRPIKRGGKKPFCLSWIENNFRFIQNRLSTLNLRISAPSREISSSLWERKVKKFRLLSVSRDCGRSTDSTRAFTLFISTPLYCHSARLTNFLIIRQLNYQKRLRSRRNQLHILLNP